MARVTTEDCIDKEPNRFKLVMVAAQRARELAKGDFTGIELDNDKHTVVALREIAEGRQPVSALHKRAVLKHQRYTDERPLDDQENFMQIGLDATDMGGIVGTRDDSPSGFEDFEDPIPFDDSK